MISIVMRTVKGIQQGRERSNSGPGAFDGGVRKGSFEVLTFGLSLGQSWGDSLLGPEGTASALIHR